MSHSDDFDDVIDAEIPDELVEELIRGAFEPELPSELMLVGRVLRAARGPIPGEDRAREAEVVEAMLAAMTVTPITAARPSSRRRRHLLVAVTAAVSVLGVGGVAAAAGGLPTPIQSFVHDSLSHVGVTVPSTEDTPEPFGPATTDTGGAPGQSGTTPGQSGATPGQSGSEPPGQSATTPGQSATTPGQSGATPGQSGSEPPGQSGNPPGQSDDAPGQPHKEPDVAASRHDDSVPESNGSDNGAGQPEGAPGQSKK
ncbi:MAG: hypothetical protein ABI658_07145 [Acidimicrobiales bacterium]